MTEPNEPVLGTIELDEIRALALRLFERGHCESRNHGLAARIAIEAAFAFGSEWLDAEPAPEQPAPPKRSKKAGQQ